MRGRGRNLDPNRERIAELEILEMTHTEFDDLAYRTLDELRGRARDLGIANVDDMNRPALVEAMYQHAH